MTSQDPPLTIDEIAQLARIYRQSVQRWHQEGAIAKVGPPVESNPVRYPKSTAVAFLKGIGYLDGRGKPTGVPSAKDPNILVQGKGRGGPERPSIDPATGKKRYYVNHLPAIFGVSKDAIATWRLRKRILVESRSDEIGRAIWYGADLRKFSKEHGKEIKPGTLT